jgi:hypothetical protein
MKAVNNNIENSGNPVLFSKTKKSLTNYGVKRKPINGYNTSGLLTDLCLMKLNIGVKSTKNYKIYNCFFNVLEFSLTINLIGKNEKLYKIQMTYTKNATNEHITNLIKDMIHFLCGSKHEMRQWVINSMYSGGEYIDNDNEVKYQLIRKDENTNELRITSE